MKCKVRLTRIVEMYVEGKDEETIMDWLREHTPEDAYYLTGGDINDRYDEEILYPIRDDADVDYIIK